MFEVISRFKDKDGKVYEKGDNYKGTKTRTDELSTNKNKYKRPFIKAPSKKSEKDKK